MSNPRPKLAAIGCSGPIARDFVEGFLQQGVELRLLARDAGAVASRYPKASVLAGSMMKPADVARAMQGVDAAFVLTPMGVNDDITLEVDAARSVIEGAQASGLKQLIYVSVLGAERRRGCAVLDAKYEVERLLAASGVPCSVLRCGSYMEDVFDPRLASLRKGTLLFPVTKERRFNYTSQKDLAPFVAQHVLGNADMLGCTLDFVAPGTYSVREVEALLTQAGGMPIRATAKFPTYYLYMAMLPYFRWKRHRFASIIPLVRYFDRHGYTTTTQTVADRFPDYRMTPLADHLRRLLAH